METQPSVPPEISVASQPERMTAWHRLLGKLLELTLTPVGITVLTEVQVGSQPPKVDVILLRRVGPTWTPEQLNLLPDGLRTSTASALLIEFKYRETINELALQQALGYDYFYPQGQQLDRTAVETFVVSAQTPQTKTLDEFGYQVTAEAGVYRSSLPMLRRIPLILLNELAPEPHNAFVQCFASQRAVRAAAFRRLNQIDWQHLSEGVWDFLMGLQSRLVSKGTIMETSNPNEEALTPELIMAIGQEMRHALLAVLTPEERLAGLAPEERLAGLAPEERLAGLAPEERLAGLAPEERLAGLAPEERLAGLAPEELAALLEQIEAYLHLHKVKPPATDKAE